MLDHLPPSQIVNFAKDDGMLRFNHTSMNHRIGGYFYADGVRHVISQAIRTARFGGINSRRKKLSHIQCSEPNIIDGMTRQCRIRNLSQTIGGI